WGRLVARNLSAASACRTSGRSTCYHHGWPKPRAALCGATRPKPTD
ncbi:MAG: hypothetical protein AVDCRST_MAG90-1188, partial [uncultured Microvirga sp.]